MSSPVRNVAIIAGTLGLGGAERQLSYQAFALQRQGIAVRVIAFEGGPWERRLRESGVAATTLESRRNSVSRLWAIQKQLSERPPDCICGAHFFVSPYVCLTARLQGVPALCTVRSTLAADLAKLPLGIGSGVLRSAHTIICNSQAAISEAVARGVPAERLFYCPNGVDRDRYRPTDEPEKAGRAQLTAVGRFVPEKRFDRYLQIVSEIQRERDVDAVLVGEGPLRSELHEQANALGLARPSFRFESADSGLTDLYRTTTALVQTSQVEGLSNVVLEAMASGVPVVASDAGGTKEAVVDGVTGFIVDGERSDMFVDRIRRLLDDPKLAADMGRQSRLRSVQEYGLDRLDQRLRELYRDVERRS